MRLTLRTLLALRDGVLDRNAAIELQQRMQQSSTAQAIAHRIDAAMADRKLNPLAIDERAPSLDANDVAQFLDGTMPPDRVPGMERKCLDHNALLAEIAASHQILSRAIQEPVPIHPSLRTRLVGLKNTTRSKRATRNSPAEAPPNRQLATPHSHNHSASLSQDASPPIAPSIENSTNGTRSRSPSLQSENAVLSTLESSTTETADTLVAPTLTANGPSNRELGGTGIELDDSFGKQVPEYLLVKQRGRWYSWGKPALLTSLLLLSASLAIGPWDRISKLLYPERVSIQSAQNASVNRSSLSAETDSQAPSDLSRGPELDSRDTPSPNMVPKATVTTEPSSAEPNTAEPTPTDATLDDQPTASADSKRPGTEVPASPRPDAPVPTPPPANAGTPPSIRLPILWKAPKNPDSIVALAHRDPQTRSWRWRLCRRDTILDGSQPMTLLPYTSSEWISPSGMRWLLSDDTLLHWIPNDSNLPRVRVLSRNALVRPAPESKLLQLELDAGILEVVFESDSSVAGIETVAHHVSINANTTPIAIQAHWTTRITAVEGSLRARWLSAPNAHNDDFPDTATPSNTSWTIKKAEQIQVTRDRVEPPHLSDAEWSQTGPPLSVTAAATVLQGLISKGVFPLGDVDPSPAATTEPLAPTETLAPPADWKPVLESLAANSDPMVASTALRGQIQLGQFFHLFGTDGVFRRPELNPHWPLILDQLFRSLANPETHPLFLDAVRTQTAERFGQILPMISLPTNVELAAGRDKALVDALSDSLIDVRALAIHQLTLITNDPLGYNPMSPSAESVQRWKSALANGTIRFPSDVPGTLQETR